MTLLAVSGRPAFANVIFEQDFSQQINGTGIFGTQPTTNVGGSVYVRSMNLASATLGTVGQYSPTDRGLLFKPEDPAPPYPPGYTPRAGSYAQNMALPFDYTFGTDRIRLTVVARQFDNTNDGDGKTYWNNFVFGFTDTDDNLSNMILLQRNHGNQNAVPPQPPNNNRTWAKIFNNGSTGSKIYRTNLPAQIPTGNPSPSINAEWFRELALEYDPTKVNIPGVNPYMLIVDGYPQSLNSVNNEDGNGPMNPNNLPPDVGLPQMTTDGGSTFNRIRGLGWGFWNANETHPITGTLMDRSVLIKSIKFEILPQVELSGDYNNDGKVDGSDYVVWRKNNGTNNELVNDYNLGTPIGAAHYNLWRANVGKVLSGSGTGDISGTTIPEPASCALICVAVFFAGASSRFLLRRYPAA